MEHTQALAAQLGRVLKTFYEQEPDMCPWGLAQTKAAYEVLNASQQNPPRAGAGDLTVTLEGLIAVFQKPENVDALTETGKSVRRDAETLLEDIKLANAAGTETNSP